MRKAFLQVSLNKSGTTTRVRAVELSLRIILTVVFITICFLGVRWVWTHQLDPRTTVLRLAKKTVAPPDWLATRDPNKIYQGGNAVGDATGSVEEKDGQVYFQQLANTGGFDREKTFEYQRLTLRVVRIGTMTGMKVEMTEKGARTLTGVFEDVVCDIVQSTR